MEIIPTVIIFDDSVNVVDPVYCALHSITILCFALREVISMWLDVSNIKGATCGHTPAVLHCSRGTSQDIQSWSAYTKKHPRFYLPKFNLCLPYYSRRGERRRWVRLKLGETIRGCFLSHILAKIIVLLVKPPRAVGSGGKGANSDGARGRVGHRESGLEKKTEKKTLCKVIDVGCRGREGNELFHRGSWIEGRTLLCQPFFLTPLHASALPSCLMLPAACQAGSPSTWHSALSTNTQTNEKTA